MKVLSWAIRFDSPIGQPRRLVFFLRDEADGVLAQAGRRRFGLHVGDESVFVFRLNQIFDGFGGCAHEKLFFPRALGANSVNCEVVMIHLEPAGLGHGRGIRWQRHVKNFTAGVAEIMAVLLHIRTEARRPAFELDLPREATFDERAEAVINRRVGNFRHRLLGADENLLRRGMVALVQQHVIHRTPLWREPKATRRQLVVQVAVGFELGGQSHGRII